MNTTLLARIITLGIFAVAGLFGLFEALKDRRAWLKRKQTKHARTPDAFVVFAEEWHRHENAIQMKKTIIRMAAVSAFLVFSPLLLSKTCRAETSDMAAVSCEIKLLLDANRTIGTNHLLNENTRTAFKIEDYSEFTVIYLETINRDYLNEGWTNRIRMKKKKTGNNKVKLTYKKRYSVQGEDIEAALSEAAADQFTPSDSQFPAQVDWGYSKMTLSFSYEASIENESLQDLDALERNSAVDMVGQNMPTREKDWLRKDWGTEALESAQMTGPVHFYRYSGELGESKIQIDVWQIPVGNEVQDIVELSVKCDNLENAKSIRENTIETLDQMNLLLHTDSLKTQIVLDGLKPEKPSGLTTTYGQTLADQNFLAG